MRDEDRDDEDRYNPVVPPPPSKSQRKRDATAVQEIGECLARLTPAQLSRVPLPDELLAAVRLARTITQRGGRKRQLQYIGKLMRRLDEAETEAIRAALATLLPGGRP
jgi:ribosome-associated protein